LDAGNNKRQQNRQYDDIHSPFIVKLCLGWYD
jgi:hypothetical protein